MSESSIDLGAAYRACRLRIGALVTDAGGDDIADVMVPATPGWSVHDVVAHVVGVAVDGTSGNMAGAPGEEWTAAQVERSRGVPIDDLLSRWSEVGPLMEAFLSSIDGSGMGGAAVLDVHTHEADLQHALGRAVSVPADVLAWAEAWLRDGFSNAVRAAGLPEVRADVSASEWFRARFGRRTADEVRAYAWRGADGAAADPEPYLDLCFIFGRAERSLGERFA